jgi:hypothetical protein
VDLSALPTLGWGAAEWIEPLRYDLGDEPEETDA